MEKKRVYQVAKEYHISSEALILMLREMKFEIKSHMSVIDEKMYANIKKQFEKQHDAAVKDIQKKKQISEAINKRTGGEEIPPSLSKRKKKKKKTIKQDSKQSQEEAAIEKLKALKKKEHPLEKKSKKSRKHRKKIDQVAVQQSYKKTMASISSDTRSKSKKSRVKSTEIEETHDDRNTVKVSEFVSLSELATQMGVPVNSLVAKCMDLGMMVSINQRIEMNTIELLAEEFGFKVEQLGEYAEDILHAREIEEDDENNVFPRPPVVTVMGHVDHGKTSLLDFIRKSHVADGESGGITQHIGAYSVAFPNGQKISFIDTPGHHAFTSMRARGAQVTDIVILIVAADDSVMPQTIEAINHAKAAEVPIIVAINKIDLPTADPEKIKGDLARHNILVEDWGGTYQCQEISAKKGINIDKLLEKILLEAEMLELTANPFKKASGVIIDSKLDKGRGAVATVLVQSGTMEIGEPFIAGMIQGRIRAMFDEYGVQVCAAGPSIPVQIFGMDGVPKAGDKLYTFDNDAEAKSIVQKRRLMKREQDFRRLKRVTLTDIYDKIKDGEIKDLNLIIKADVDGSVEALCDSLTQITHEEVRVKVIHQGVGGINENDVLLAAASGAIIIGFHVRPAPAAKALAESENVDIKLYEIIYEVIDDVKKALSGLLKPVITEKVMGTAEVRTVFKVPRIGNIAGCYVTNGIVKRSAKLRLIRDNIEIFSSKISSLKRFKEDVSEVTQGYECGIGVESFNDIKVGDNIEMIEVLEEARRL
ncbi:MAG: translation initiation factor IF-2 [Candidatus Latescibacteria bacterium]|nr:translation initiation factor IF-2 [Candidatus Latescibacterota bacterium]